MTSCSGFDNLYKYCLVVQSDLMHNLNFSNLIYTAYKHLLQFWSCYRAQCLWYPLEAEMATEKPLYDSPCLHSIITLAAAQLQTLVDAITYVIAFWYPYFCNII